MKIGRKIFPVLIAFGVFSVFAAGWIVAFGMPALCRLVEAMRNPGLEIEPEDTVAVAGLAGILLLFVTAGVLVMLLIRLMRPVRDAAKFADQLAAGEMPPVLPVTGCGCDEVSMLVTSLNFLRDRQQNLQGKLKLSLSREAEVRREIERHDSLQLQLLNGMLPEMRQPLSLIKGFSLVIAQLLNMPQSEQNHKELISMLIGINRRVGSLSRQVERLIDICALGRERSSTLHLEEVETADFLREISERNALSLQAREVTLVNRFSASAPAAIRIDRELLSQLMAILIRAVARASGPGETVMLSCFRERHMVVLEVRDSRRAPCREELAREFEEFRKEEETESTPPEPRSLSVLALCFVRDIAAKAGMRLAVRSTGESCSVLRLELDDKDCRVGESGARADQWRSSRTGQLDLPGSEEAAEGEPAPLRILLGDDNADEAMIITRLLAADSITVDAVDSADAMVKAVEKVAYDGFVMVAPYKSCAPAELVERLRQAAGRRELPAVVVDNQISEMLFRQVRSLDRVWAMAMPLNYALLARLLRQAAGRGRAR